MPANHGTLVVHFTRSQSIGPSVVYDHITANRTSLRENVLYISASVVGALPRPGVDKVLKRRTSTNPRTKLFQLDKLREDIVVYSDRVEIMSTQFVNIISPQGRPGDGDRWNRDTKAGCEESQEY